MSHDTTKECPPPGALMLHITDLFTRTHAIAGCTPAAH